MLRFRERFVKLAWAEGWRERQISRSLSMESRGVCSRDVWNMIQTWSWGPAFGFNQIGGPFQELSLSIIEPELWHTLSSFCVILSLNINEHLKNNFGQDWAQHLPASPSPPYLLLFPCPRKRHRLSPITCVASSTASWMPSSLVTSLPQSVIASWVSRSVLRVSHAFSILTSAVSAQPLPLHSCDNNQRVSGCQPF